MHVSMRAGNRKRAFSIGFAMYFDASWVAQVIRKWVTGRLLGDPMGPGTAYPIGFIRVLDDSVCEQKFRMHVSLRAGNRGRAFSIGFIRYYDAFWVAQVIRKWVMGRPLGDSIGPGIAFCIGFIRVLLNKTF